MGPVLPLDDPRLDLASAYGLVVPRAARALPLTRALGWLDFAMGTRSWEIHGDSNRPSRFRSHRRYSSPPHRTRRDGRHVRPAEREERVVHPGHALAPGPVALISGGSA